MEKDIDSFVQGLLRYDPTVTDRAQEQSLEMLALLLIVVSAPQVRVGPVEASILNSALRNRIWQSLEACAPEISSWKVVEGITAGRVKLTFAP